MFSIVLKSALVLIFCRMISSEMSEAVRTLCNDTYIDAADRLPNKTYRVYRGEQYWELERLPEQSSDNHFGPLVVKGPFIMSLSYWEPLKRGDTLCTVIGNSNHNGHLFRWNQNKYTVWNTNGDIIITDKQFPAIPENGFSAVFNNGGLDPERPTLIIGFSESGVYYIKPDLNFGSTLYKEAKGFPKGQFDENFPSGVTAALPLPSIDPDVDYYVYLFKGEQYCFRPNSNVTAEDGCPEWRNNSQLFGCEFPKPTTPVPEPKQEIAVQNSNSNPESICGQKLDGKQHTK